MGSEMGTLICTGPLPWWVVSSMASLIGTGFGQCPDEFSDNGDFGISKVRHRNGFAIVFPHQRIMGRFVVQQESYFFQELKRIHLDDGGQATV